MAEGTLTRPRLPLRVGDRPDQAAHRPAAARQLAAGRAVALISGTSGNPTITRLTTAALGMLGPVATNSFGANMPSGHTSALARAGRLSRHRTG